MPYEPAALTPTMRSVASRRTLQRSKGMASEHEQICEPRSEQRSRSGSIARFEVPDPAESHSPFACLRPSTTDPKSRPGYGTDRSRGTRAERSDAIKKDALGEGRKVPARSGTELSDRRTIRLLSLLALDRIDQAGER